MLERLRAQEATDERRLLRPYGYYGRKHYPTSKRSRFPNLQQMRSYIGARPHNQWESQEVDSALQRAFGLLAYLIGLDPSRPSTPDYHDVRISGGDRDLTMLQTPAHASCTDYRNPSIGLASEMGLRVRPRTCFPC